MEMADFWLLEKQLVHKLFKVLAPRFENYTISYTRMYKASRLYPEGQYPRSILELRGKNRKIPIILLLCSHLNFLNISFFTIVKFINKKSYKHIKLLL